MAVNTFSLHHTNTHTYTHTHPCTTTLTSIYVTQLYKFDVILTVHRR